MQKITKMFLSVLLMLTMVFALSCMSAAAEETTPPVEVSDAAGLIAAVANGGSIKLTDDITLTETLDITVDTTIDGGNHTITSSNRKAITIQSGLTVAFSNVTIKNTNTEDGTRCIGTYGGNITLTLTGVTLESNATNGQTVLSRVS